MIFLPPIALFCLIHVVMHAYRRRWKNASLYLFAAAISMLLYSHGVYAAINRSQKRNIIELNAKVLELELQQREKK